MEPALSVGFKVKIDDNNLGVFNSCEGLGIEMVMETREEGGNNTMVWQLPTRMKYSNVKLSRPIGPDSAKIALWFASMATGVKPTTMEITALTIRNQEVVTWSLLGVVPVRWTGPTLNYDTVKVATETLEIAHHGIMAKPGAAA